MALFIIHFMKSATNLLKNATNNAISILKNETIIIIIIKILKKITTTTTKHHKFLKFIILNIPYLNTVKNEKKIASPLNLIFFSFIEFPNIYFFSIFSFYKK